MLTPATLKIGGRYNWKNQPERLVYVGMCEPRNGRWHQFEKVNEPGKVWCEVLPSDLHLLEETPSGCLRDKRIAGENASPATHKLVPLEPTLEMIAAGEQAGKYGGFSEAECYRRMVDAAPGVAVTQTPGENDRV